jgi:hypothetical protein
VDWFWFFVVAWWVVLGVYLMEERLQGGDSDATAANAVDRLKATSRRRVS